MSAYPDDDSAGFDPVQTINDYADYYGAPADLAQAVMQREAGGNHYDRDGRLLTSSRGYRGLMGMHPVTAAGLGLGFNADDPEENVHAGLKYLGQNLEEFDGNQALALAGYHVGPHRAVAALSDPGDPRTKSYVKSILGPDYGGYWQEGSGDQPSGPGRSVSGMQNAGSGESEPPVAGTANLRLPPNSFQQVLQRMLASKDESTLSDSRAILAHGQPTDDSTVGAPSEGSTRGLGGDTSEAPGPADEPTGRTGAQYSAGDSARRERALPQWLRTRFDAGKEFDRLNRPRYRYNELELVDAKGRKSRVDSYDPDARHIVSRRLTQLAEIKESTAISYLNQLTQKYPSGVTISHSPFNPKALRGQRLRGDLVFEVPVQKKPVPRTVLDAASKRGIIIRDVTGRVY
jgi:hypothetical protein